MIIFTVYNHTASRTLVPWRIHTVNPPDITFRGFYYHEATCFIEGGLVASRLELDSTFLGTSRVIGCGQQSKGNGRNHRFRAVCQVYCWRDRWKIYSRWALYRILLTWRLSTCSYIFTVLLQTTNAFDVLRNSRLQSHPALPEPVTKPRNHKQKLWNDFITFLSDKDFKWHADEIGRQSLTLRLIDGHVFKSRDHPIPSSFHSFTGYNQPQLSITNMTGRTCHALLSVSVQIHCLDACKKRSCWKEFNPLYANDGCSRHEYHYM